MDMGGRQHYFRRFDKLALIIQYVLVFSNAQFYRLRATVRNVFFYLLLSYLGDVGDKREWHIIAQLS